MALDRDAINAKALASLTADGNDVGGTGSAYVFTVETTRLDIDVQQQFSPIKRIKNGMTAQSAVAIREMHLINLAMAFDQPDAQVVSSVLTLNADAERGEVPFIAVTKGGGAPGASDANDRTISMPQSVVSGGSALNYDRDAPIDISTTWDHNPDNSSDFGTITDAAV